MVVVKSLYLMRHAKSSWADPALADHDRPLAGRGRRAALAMGEHMRSQGVRPHLVLCSSARRARQTLEALHSVLAADVGVSVEAGLYHADSFELLDRLRALDDEIPSVMVIGHNPALQDLARELVGGGDAGATSQLRTKFPTAALATLEVDLSSWTGLSRGQAHLARLVLPRQLDLKKD